MGKFFDDMKQGLEEAIAFEKSKTTLRTRLVEIPEPPHKLIQQQILKESEIGLLTHKAYLLKF